MANSLANIDTAMVALQAALAKVQADAVKELHKLAQRARASVADGFKREITFTRNGGRPIPIKPYGPRWAAEKRRMGYSMKRGTATSGVQKTLDRRDAVRLTKRGFVLDFLDASLRQGTTYRNRRVGAARRGGKPFRRPASRQTLVFNYISFLADQKAAGLGNMPAAMRTEILNRVTARTEKQLLRIAKSIGPASTLRGGVRLKMSLMMSCS